MVFVDPLDDCSKLIHSDINLPLYLMPIVYGHYSDDNDLKWTSTIDSLLMNEWIHEIQRVLKKSSSRDRMLRSY